MFGNVTAFLLPFFEILPLASITPSSDQGSGKRSTMNKKDPKVWRPGRTRKARIKNQDEKTIVPLKNLENSQNNVHSVNGESFNQYQNFL